MLFLDHFPYVRLNQNLSEDQLLALVARSLMYLVAVAHERNGLWGQRPKKVFHSVLYTLT